MTDTQKSWITAAVVAATIALVWLAIYSIQRQSDRDLYRIYANRLACIDYPSDSDTQIAVGQMRQYLLTHRADADSQ